MQTHLAKDLLATETGKAANKILRSCVHCGFCLSTCPTYQLLGDELDSPRGRIYLIKSVLEGNPVSADTQTHLDRCLTCRACETTCPSGVEYAKLLDIGREMVSAQQPRNLFQKSLRYLLRKSLTTPWWFNGVIKVMPFLRHSKAVQFTVEELAWHETLKQQDNLYQHSVLLITGCVQPALAPNINQASIKIFNKLGFNVFETGQQACCGAIDHHLTASEEALVQIKQNIDDWTAQLDKGLKAIISNASGCGVMIKDYPSLFRDDAVYRQKALRLVDHVYDVAEFLVKQDLSKFTHYHNKRITFHSPCTLQHGQKLNGVVEEILRKVGYHVSPVQDAHLCCGSAGTYSILQPTLSKKLRVNKIEHLTQSHPEIIVTANIGCLMHLQKGTRTPIKHWIEIIQC